jgi:5-formyltetrahydrofolate cyclo-ligase
MTLVPAASADTSPDLKAEIRARILAHRDALPAETRMAAAEAIARRGLPCDVPADAVLSGFMPIRSEINPLPLMRRYAENGIGLALPAIVQRGLPLAMRAWRIGDELATGQWKIREPGADAPEVAPDIMLVPLAAFDRRGHRIGYGAGYYDRTIETLRARKRVTAIGIAYAMQEVDRVPATGRDQPLDFVMTEREAIACMRA